MGLTLEGLRCCRRDCNVVMRQKNPTKVPKGEMSQPNLTSVLLQMNEWPVSQLANLKLAQVSLCYVVPCS